MTLRRVAIFLGAAMLGSLFVAVASADPSSTSRLHWITNGSVRSVAVIGDTLYVGGSFTRVAPTSAALGALYRVSRTSGAALLGFPMIDGQVQAIEADGTGGYYIGGQFNSVGGETHINLAHVKADGTVDSVFNPVLSGTHRDVSAVTSIVRGTSALFVAGGWQTINGSFRQSVVALNPVTGSLTPWAPTELFGVPSKLLLNGSNVIVVGGLFAAQAFAIDQATGATIWLRTLRSFGTTSDAVISGSRLIICGSFLGTPDTIRNIVSINVTTGVIDTSWAPNSLSGESEQFTSLAVSGSTLYIGGVFSTFNGAPRLNAAAINIDTVTLTNWAPNPVGEVHDLFVSNSGNVFMAGAFNSVAGVARENLAEIDSVGNATAWIANVYSRSARALLAVGATDLIVGGEMALTGGVGRSGLAAFDLATDSLLPWSPTVTDSVVKIGAVGGTIVVNTTSASRFHSLSGVHATNGAILWRHDAGRVDRLLFDTDAQHAYIYSSDSAIRLDAAGVRDPLWRVVAAGIFTMAVSGETVYVGGSFSSLQNTPRRRLGAVDRQTAALSPWAPTTSTDFPEAIFTIEKLYADQSAVSAFEPTQGTYYITSLGRYDVNSAQRVSAPGFNGTLSTKVDDGVTVDGIEVRAFGTTRESATTLRTIPRMGVLGAARGQLTPWNPGYTLIDGNDWYWPTADLLLTPTDLIVAGYQGVEHGVVYGISVLPRQAPTIVSDLRASVINNQVTLSWLAPTPPPPSGYVLDVGSAPAMGYITSIPTNGTTFSGTAPSGTYFIQVRGAGGPEPVPWVSNEIAVTVGCPSQLFAPMQFGVAVDGTRVTLSWAPPLFVKPSGYLIEAATADGSQRFTIPVSGSQLQYVAAAPPGDYKATVRATSACGMSESSGEVAFRVGSESVLPSAPSDLQLSIASRIATVRWSAVANATGYIVEVGRGPGQSDIGVFRVTTTEIAGPIAPFSLYYARVRALNAAGIGSASRELVISTP